MTKAILVSQFLRARAWWRLDSAGPNAVYVARSVVSLIDAAGYVHSLRDDDPDLAALDAAGCFVSGLFDPGPQGWAIVRDWQLAETATAGPEELLAQLAQAASHDGPAAQLASLTRPAPPAVTIPHQAGPATERVLATERVPTHERASAT